LQNTNSIFSYLTILAKFLFCVEDAQKHYS